MYICEGLGRTSTNLTMSATASLKKLDQYTEQLLLLVEKYIETQQSIEQWLSEGYLNLASANKSLRSNARYGSDMYDERCHDAAVTIVESETNLQINSNDSKAALKSFGIFTPLSLKQAQKQFNRGLEDMVGVVNLQSQIKAIEDKIESEKEKLNANSPTQVENLPQIQNLS